MWLHFCVKTNHKKQQLLLVVTNIIKDVSVQIFHYSGHLLIKFMLLIITLNACCCKYCFNILDELQPMEGFTNCLKPSASDIFSSQLQIFSCTTLSFLFSILTMDCSVLPNSTTTCRFERQGVKPTSWSIHASSLATRCQNREENRTFYKSIVFCLR